MPEIRPMVPDDAGAVTSLAVQVFEDLDRRMNRPAGRRPNPAPAMVRHRHLATTDPDGALVAVEDSEVVGAAEAIVRDGVWGLSLLIVHPKVQGSGLGGELLARTLAYGEGTRGGIILSSEDPRALRTYARAGFDLRPTMDAAGAPVRRPASPPSVRPARWPEDAELVDRAGLAVRGAGHAGEIPAFQECGAEVLVHEGGGFAVFTGGEVRVLAATEDEIAADLLRGVLNAIAPGQEAFVEFIAAGQDWAVEVVLDAGLSLRPGGAIFTRGEVGPMAPYLPSGAYL